MKSINSFGGVGLLIKDKKILLIKRLVTAKKFPNCWTPPGGKSENGETPKQTCKREVSEEVGIIISEPKLYRDSMWEGKSIFTFTGNFEGSVEVQDDEVQEYGWFDYDEAMKLDLGFHYRDIIQELSDDGLL